MAEINRRKLRRRASPLVVLGLIVALAAATAWLLPPQLPMPPAILRFTLLDGRTVALADLRGQAVLVAFWATTCAPCVDDVSDLNRLYDDLEPRGFKLIAVAMPYDPPLQVQRFVEQHGVAYPVAVDPLANVNVAFGGLDFVPTAFLLDPTGEVVSRYTGKLDIAQVRRRVEPLLGDTPARN